MIERPRRLRTTAAMRKLVRETRPRPAQLVLPVFVGESPAEIGAMPGVRRHTVEQIGDIARSAAEAGLGGIMLFGVPMMRTRIRGARRPGRPTASNSVPSPPAGKRWAMIW